VSFEIALQQTHKKEAIGGNANRFLHQRIR
jgi:hypothetical protein